MSKIEWTEKTWNPVTGCTKCSPGCLNCYAERMTKRQVAMGTPKYKAGFDRVVCHEPELDRPLKWKKPSMIFVNSMSDTFHEDVPVEFLIKMFAVMAATTNHFYQVLTKRPLRMVEFLSLKSNHLKIWKTAYSLGMISIYKRNLHDKSWKVWPLPNIHIGLTVCNQDEANKKIPYLLQIPAEVRFLSIEPMLGPVDLRNLDTDPELSLNALTGIECMCEMPAQGPKLDWVIVGCESINKKLGRLTKIEWIEDVVNQCVEAGVPVFVKQAGIDGKLVKMPEIMGKVWDQMPEVTNG